MPFTSHIISIRIIWWRLSEINDNTGQKKAGSFKSPLFSVRRTSAVLFKISDYFADRALIQNGFLVHHPGHQGQGADPVDLAGQPFGVLVGALHRQPRTGIIQPI